MNLKSLIYSPRHTIRINTTNIPVLDQCTTMFKCSSIQIVFELYSPNIRIIEVLEYSSTAICDE